MLEKICIIGSGNWGSAISKIIGNNVLRNPTVFDKNVTMWVFEETVDGRPLSDWINNSHLNPKYLPGIPLPSNIIAEPDLLKAVKDKSVLVWVIPHQFVKSTCNALKGYISPGCRAVSLIKGIDANTKGLSLISDLIGSSLGIDVSVLMGANIANEVAQDKFCEATIGCRVLENANILKMMFHTKSFNINCVEDVEGVELCGALKNIVAIAAGLVDGLGLGENTKAAVMRIGLVEMKNFVDLFHLMNASETGKKKRESHWATFFESCGVADVITTCYGGRNKTLAEQHVKTGKSFEVLEVEMLNGQKLQGNGTSKEVYEVLSARNQVHRFPLFVSVYRVCYEGMKPDQLIESLSSWSGDHHTSSSSESD